MTMSNADMPAGAASEATPAGPRSDRPKRRTFTAAYKLAMVAAYDSATGPGEKGALLRREGLYDSHIISWRKARDAGGLNALGAARPRGTNEARVELERLRKENARLAGKVEKLEAKLDRTETALDLMGKARALLEMVSESADSMPRSTR